MIEYPTRKLAVILEREAVESRWESHRWQLLGVIPDVGGEPRTITDTPQRLQRLFPGFEVKLFPDEAEGYYLNVSSEEPSVFVSIRNDEGAVDPYPFQDTLSYNEAARWVGGGQSVRGDDSFSPRCSRLKISVREGRQVEKYAGAPPALVPTQDVAPSKDGA